MVMNYNPAPPTPEQVDRIYDNMAKWEIMSRYGPIDGLWWNFMPGVEVEVAWPSGMITVDHDHPRWDPSLGATYQQGFSADPNDFYRTWLEENVGRQRWDWNWRIGQVCNAPGTDNDTLIIKFRKGKEKYATIAALRWS